MNSGPTVNQFLTLYLLNFVPNLQESLRLVISLLRLTNECFSNPVFLLRMMLTRLLYFMKF